MIGSIGVLSISAMPKAAEDTKPLGALLSEDGPPIDALRLADVQFPRGTKTNGTGVEETRVKGGDRAPDDTAADPDTD
jgi:hypothetical protein